MADFPTSVVALTNPVSTDTLASPSHSGQHASENNEIEAIETYLLGALSVSPKAYGAVGDGTTDDTVALQAAFDDGVPLHLRDTYAVTGLNVPAGSRLYFEGGSLKALDVSNVLTITGNDVEIRNLNVNLNSQSFLALTGNLFTGIRLLGHSFVENAKVGGGNVNGGLIFLDCDDLTIESLELSNLYQVNSATSGLYRGLDLSSCDGFSIGRVVMRGGDICVNLFGSTSGSIAEIHATDLTDNALYISDVSQDILIGTVYAKDVGEGIVLASEETDANIQIGTALINNALAKGVALRDGAGYTIGSLTLIESSLSQDTSAAPRASRIVIGSLRAYQTTRTDIRPILLTGNTHVMFGAVMVAVGTPLGGDAIRLIDCDRVQFSSLVIQGIAAAITQGMRIESGGAPVADPNIRVLNFSAQNATTPYIVTTAVKTNVVIEHGVDIVGNRTYKQDGTVTLQLERTATALTAGNIIGTYVVRGNDASSAGLKYQMETQAYAGNGGFGITIFRDDGGNEVGRVVSSVGVTGMTVKLPTASTGLVSGELWNNAGTITVVA